jgi:starch phosphorylase
VEIADKVGSENIEIFGLKTEEVDRYKAERNYYSWDEYNSNPRIRRVVDELVDGTFGRLSGNFSIIYDALMRNNDEFFVLKDFDSYLKAWHNLETLYGDKAKWDKIAIHNTAMSGYFSSDRTIKQYAEEVWDL